MNIKRILVGSLTAFSATLITCFAIVLGIILPWIPIRRARDK